MKTTYSHQKLSCFIFTLYIVFFMTVETLRSPEVSDAVPGRVQSVTPTGRPRRHAVFWLMWNSWCEKVWPWRTLRWDWHEVSAKRTPEEQTRVLSPGPWSGTSPHIDSVSCRCSTTTVWLVRKLQWAGLKVGKARTSGLVFLLKWNVLNLFSSCL